MKVMVVVGHVWSSKKEESLSGTKLMIVEDYLSSENAQFAAADLVGAGIGEKVLVTQGSSARNCLGESSLVDAAIVGIVDDIEITKG